MHRKIDIGKMRRKDFDLVPRDGRLYVALSNIYASFGIWKAHEIVYEGMDMKDPKIVHEL